MSMLDTGGAAEVQSQCPDHYWAKWLWIAAAAGRSGEVGWGLLPWSFTARWNVFLHVRTVTSKTSVRVMTEVLRGRMVGVFI